MIFIQRRLLPTAIYRRVLLKSRSEVKSLISRPKKDVGKYEKSI